MDYLQGRNTLARRSVQNKPEQCEDCYKTTEGLVYFKKKWVCPECLNKVDSEKELNVKDHMYSGLGPEW